MVDPGGDAAELMLKLAELETSVAAILITHGHWDHLGGVADLAEGTGAPVYMAEAERACSRTRRSSYREARALAPTPPTSSSWATRRSSSPASTSRRSRPGPLAGAPRLPRRRLPFSGDVLFAGSVGRTDLPAPTGDADRLDPQLIERFPPETIVYSGHGPPTTLGAELERNPFLTELRAS